MMALSVRNPERTGTRRAVGGAKLDQATPTFATTTHTRPSYPHKPRPHLRGERPSMTLMLTYVVALTLMALSAALGVDATDGGMVDNSAPRFLEPIPNKTVVVGRDVILPCSVDNLKGFKVAWVFVETQTILTIHHTIITKNPRFSLARNDHKHWYLKISDVRSSDRGQYMCQVNSDPMINQVGYLDVQVPPDIIDEESSSEVTVKEGHDVTLVCRARGSPKPVISWKREDGGRIDLNNGINLRVTNSEVLHIPSVSRLHMGAYLCIASNEVPPSVSKRIMLNVQFQPVLWIPNQLVGVALGMSVTLECHTEAFPRSINYWTDDKGKMILSSGTGGRFDTVVTENSYRAYMRLKIKNVQPEDYMSYGCYAKNSLGETNGSIKVYEIPRELMVNPPAPEPTQPDEDQVKLERENQTKNLRPKEDQERGGERRGGRQRFDDDDVVSTMTADGYIEFDVQKLLGKSNRSNRKDPENKTRPDRRGQGHRSGISENHPLHNTPPTSSSPPRPRPGHALNASLISGLLAAWLLHALAAARQRV